jgi:hypothetical protein
MNNARTLPLLVLGAFLNFSVISATEAADALDPKKILEALPKDLLKDISGNVAKRKEAVDAASRKLQETFREKNGTLTFRVVETNKSNGRYSASAEHERVRIAGTNYDVSYHIYFEESENARAAQIKPGDKITASGLAMILLHGSSGSFEYTLLSISLHDAKLK